MVASANQSDGVHLLKFLPKELTNSDFLHLLHIESKPDPPRLACFQCMNKAGQVTALKVMQELLGYSDISQTSNIYTHVSLEFEQQEAAKMSIILG